VFLKETVSGNYPLVRLIIEIPKGYPDNESPKVTVEGIFGLYNDQIVQKLSRDKWDSGQLVLYEWYTYCKTEMI
jgi:hypothetical protein